MRLQSHPGTLSGLGYANADANPPDTKFQDEKERHSSHAKSSFKDGSADSGPSFSSSPQITPLVQRPPPNERVLCSVQAALKYGIPANVLLAVAEKEGGKPGQWVKNKNGTHDVGTMQFNTGYLKELAKYGITAQDVAQPGCYPYDLAAWRLRGHLRDDTGDVWTRAANYHSRTPHFNALYRADLQRRGARWAAWLEGRFATVTLPPEPPRAKPSLRALPVSTGYVPRRVRVGS